MQLWQVSSGKWKTIFISTSRNRGKGCEYNSETVSSCLQADSLYSVLINDLK